MKNHSPDFNEEHTLKELKRLLPAQAPLKDFIFQNNLEAFQNFNFFDGLNHASDILGYKVFLSLQEFRELHKNGRISEQIIDRLIVEKKGNEHIKEWKQKMLHFHYPHASLPRVGRLRPQWKKIFGINIDSLVHPTLFSIVCSYLDQGISIWNFPLWTNGFLLSIKEMEENSYTSFFHRPRARKLLLSGNYELKDLLKILVGNEAYYEQYLFDQQFAHQGWSGMVSVVETHPETLMDKKIISLKDFITFELLLEIDALDLQYGTNWSPLALKVTEKPINLFKETVKSELHEVYQLWQEAFEWTYYDEALAGLQTKNSVIEIANNKTFQSFFCIDDRETSFRDYIEKQDPNCETYGTPGFFNIEFYFQPQDGKALTKLCPAPVTPKYLIKELGASKKRKKDHHFNKQTFSLSAGWLISQTLGFWAAIELVVDIFRPTMGPSTASSFKHMDEISKLSIENLDPKDIEHGLQVGFSIEEMATRVEGQLKSIGLVSNYAPFVYVIGHGASSVNNPFYTTMDCGACSCRPGSVNARAFCFMANHPRVREILASKGIEIPASTIFIGGLHDTTRDEIVFYDEKNIAIDLLPLHKKNVTVFQNALALNAKERSRRFESINTTFSLKRIHEKIKARSVSLYEPRPELDHATNAITVIGSRKLTRNLFLDRRAFLNSYDYRTDTDGKLLQGIMQPIAPVCGGINLSYYFARVDNNKLGAGSKLPHNVMGLIGVANGVHGDLRPGLPSQMIESHDPVRQLVIVEHYPNVLLSVVKKLSNYEWYYNNWLHLVAIHPETKDIYVFKDGEFQAYTPLYNSIQTITNQEIESIIESSHSQSNLPVYIIS
jgi:uncharacterized protein